MFARKAFNKISSTHTISSSRHSTWFSYSRFTTTPNLWLSCDEASSFSGSGFLNASSRIVSDEWRIHAKYAGASPSRSISTSRHQLRIFWYPATDNVTLSWPACIHLQLRVQDFEIQSPAIVGSGEHTYSNSCNRFLQINRMSHFIPSLLLQSITVISHISDQSYVSFISYRL